MSYKWFVLFASIFLIQSCGVNKPDRGGLSPEIRELNAYRIEESQRCSGSSYRTALGIDSGATLTGNANISETLLSKGYGTGSLDIGITLKEKTELATLLGNLNSTQVENFLNSYKGCMDDSMIAFYRVKGLEYPEKPNSNNVVWGEKIFTVEGHTTAYQTEHTGNWRYYEVCADIPDNALMMKDTVSTRVIGVGPGSWGDWKKDTKFVNNNAYGPTKVCKGFDHQIHDQNRELYLSVSYKLPK